MYRSLDPAPCHRPQKDLAPHHPHPLRPVAAGGASPAPLAQRTPTGTGLTASARPAEPHLALRNARTQADDLRGGQCFGPNEDRFSAKRLRAASRP